MKKMAVICTLYGPHGGTGRVTTEIIERYAKDGNEVHVFCAESDKEFAKESAVKSINIINITHIGLLKQVDLLFKASRLIKQNDYDIIYTTGDYHLNPDIVTIHTLKVMARKTIAKYEREKIIPCANSRIKSFLRQIYCPLIYEIGERIVYKKKGVRYVCVSEGVKRDFCKLFPEQTENTITIANAVDSREYSPNPIMRERIRKQYDIKADQKVMLFVGSDWACKRLDVSIRVTAKQERIILLVAGHDNVDPYKKLAKELHCEERVHFLGFRSDVADYYAAADYFIFSSVYETFGLVALEAMASGVAVISNRLNGVEDYIIDGENGYITRDVSVESFSEIVGFLLAHPDVEKTVRQNALRRARELNWDNCYAQYKKLFDEYKRG